jgi:hypothetical protein
MGRRDVKWAVEPGAWRGTGCIYKFGNHQLTVGTKYRKG